MVEGSRVRRKFLAHSLGEQAQGELLKKKKKNPSLPPRSAPYTALPLLVPQRSMSLPAVCPKLQLHFWGLKTKQETVQNNPDPVGDRCLGRTSPAVRPLTFAAGTSTVTSFPVAKDFRGTLRGVAEVRDIQLLLLEL